jgi:hypothetical protein
MTAHELLNVLNKRVIKGSISGEALVQDLNELLLRFDNANYRQKILGALEWAAISARVSATFGAGAIR